MVSEVALPIWKPAAEIILFMSVWGPGETKLGDDNSLEEKFSGFIRAQILFMTSASVSA